MAFLEVVPKGKFGVQVKSAAVDLLKKYKLSALPDPSSLGKNLSSASPDLAAKLTDFDGLLKKIQPLPPQGTVNWETPNWNSIAAQFGVFPPENPTKDQLTNARTLLQEKYALKIAKLVAKAEAVHAHADPNAAASNLRNFVSTLPKELSGGVRNTIEGLIKSVTNRVQSTSPSGDKEAVLKQYKNLKGDVEDEEKKRNEHLTDANVKQYAQSLNHPINQYLAPLTESAKKIHNRPNPRAQAIWDQTQIIFETMELEWNLRSAFAHDQIKHYQQELELVDQMEAELDDTQADHLLILKPHLVDEILAKFYDMKIGEEEQELHLPSGFETLQEIEDASNAYLKEHKEFNDAEVLTTHLIDEETHAMLAAGEHH